MPKTLRPPPSLSRPTRQRQRPGTQSHVNNGDLCQRREQVECSDVGVTESTKVPLMSPLTVATTISQQHRARQSSDADVPDSCVTEPSSPVPLPPPLPPPPSLPPPPAPPLLPGHGKLPLATAPGGRDMNGTDAGSSMQLSPPGPAPVLRVRPGCESTSLTSLKSTGISDKPPVNTGIDLTSIEAARLRLKKPTRTDNSATCKFISHSVNQSMWIFKVA